MPRLNHVLIAYGFAAREPSSRRLVMTMSILIIVYAIATDALNLIHHAIMWRAIINASVFGGASAWYFYFKPNVAAYFRELRDRIPVVNSQKYSESIESERNKRAAETALDFCSTRFVQRARGNSR